MIYAYRCDVCGAPFDTNTRFSTQCPECLNTGVRRDYSSVQIGVTPFQPHFNHAVGAYVSSSRQFNDLLSAASEKAGSSYTRVDPGDVPRPTKDDAIFDTQARTIRDRHINPEDLV